MWSKKEEKRVSVEVENWAKIFDAIGNPLRLGILMILFGSGILHKGEKHSLGFTNLKRIMRIPNDATLNHHLDKLIKTGLVQKKPLQETLTSKIIPIYSVTDKTDKFFKEINLDETIEEFIKEKM